MKKEYSRDFFISYNEVDKDLKLGIVNAFGILQTMSTEYFTSFNSDNITIRAKNNAVWVATKTKMHFNNFPKWRTYINGNSFTTKITPIRVETETHFTNENDEILFFAKQESCAIDVDNRKIRKLNTINYPMDLEIKNSIDKVTYQKLNEEFSENDKIYEQKIYSTDIDYSGHTNNVFYVRYILNALSNDFLDHCQITDFEIHYISESKEGETLEVYKKIKENEIQFVIKEKEREIARASIKYI